MSIQEYTHKIAKGAVLVFLGMILGRAITYLYIILLAKLGSTEYGLLNLGFTLISIFSVIAIFGLRKGIVRYIAYFKEKKDEPRIKGTILSSLKISLPISLILASLLFFFPEFISNLLFNKVEMAPILKIFSLVIPFLTLTEVFTNSTVGFQEVKYQVWIRDIIPNIIKLALTYFLISLGYSLMGVAWAYVIAVIIASLLSFYFLQKKVFPIYKNNIKAKLITKSLFIYSAPLIFAGLLQMIIRWADVLMIGRFRTISEVGIYSVTLPTANLLTIAPTALMALFLPIITGLYSKNKSKDIHKISETTSRWILITNLPIFFFILLYSKEILKIMFGSEYVLGTTALIILIFAYMIRSLAHVHASILNMIKKNKTLFKIIVISSILNIILNYLLIPTLGIEGGAIATAVALLVNFILLTLSAYKFEKIQPLKWKFYSKIILVGLFVYILMFILKPLILVDNLWMLLLAALVYGFIYVILIFIFKLIVKEDKIFIKKILTKLRG